MNRTPSHSPMLEPEEHVLSTLERDGARRWLRPKLSPGRLFHLRRYVAYVLIAVFTIIPFLRINGNPVLLLDIMNRRFTIMGYVFLPTDTVLLALFLIGLLLTIFLMTAIFGRVWCGWACPQTVYMEYVFRPIERLLDGTVGRGGEPKKNRGQAALRWLLRYVIYLVICFYLANTFLAYFIGTETLLQWVRQSPFQHPVPFLIVGFVTVMMMFDFSFFREQMCIIACPYGRFQSVLLDQNSLIVSYDARRGEPRGKVSKKAQAKEKTCDGNCDGNCKNKKQEAVSLQTLTGQKAGLGDCVDCGRCVTTCPTGIDIRNGLQMECINCTQCIDACNDVMVKLGREPNLIRYSSQSADCGQNKGILRPRVIIYPLLLTIVGSIFAFLLLTKNPFDAAVWRDRSDKLPFRVVESGQVRNLLKLKIANRQQEDMTFQIKVLEPAKVQLEVMEPDFQVAALATREFHVNVDTPFDTFDFGKSQLTIEVINDKGQIVKAGCRLQGPMSEPAAPAADRSEASATSETSSESDPQSQTEPAQESGQ